MVWCAMHKTRIIGSYFFRTPTVNTQAYKSMLSSYGLRHVAQLPGSPIFQQDGAPAHTSNATSEYLQRNLETGGLANEALQTGLRDLRT